MRALARSLRLAAAALLAVASGGCPKNTATEEMRLAQDALEEALRAKAKDCAAESYRTAEAALQKAKAQEQAGEVDAAKQTALQATVLAKRATKSVAADCGVAKTEPPPPPPPHASDATNASAGATLGGPFEWRPIYFDFNESAVRDDSKAYLAEVASQLQAESVRLRIEGHTDNRGSTEYNLALGERRAAAVRKYLGTLGVAPDRLSILTYGEERPAEPGNDETAHAKNRRSELKIVAP